jgi:hypothetical protein
MTLPNLPHPSQLARNVPVFPALKKRREHQSNIWFFDSPKNNLRLILHTDIAFIHFVMLEGDPTVLRSIPRPGQEIVLLDGVRTEISVDAHVHRSDGTVEWWDFKRVRTPSHSREKNTTRPPESSAQRAATAASATYRVMTDADFSGREIFFDNWLTLCAAINRCRNHFLGREADLFRERMAVQHAVTLDNLLSMPEIDTAYMLAVIALALQSGTASANLTGQILGRSTTISRSTP